MGWERRLREQLGLCVWVRARSPARRKISLRTQPSCLGRRVGRGPASLSAKGPRVTPPLPNLATSSGHGRRGHGGCGHGGRGHSGRGHGGHGHGGRGQSRPSVSTPHDLILTPAPEAPQLCTSAGTWEGHGPGSRSPRLPLPRRAERAGHRLDPLFPSRCRTPRAGVLRGQPPGRRP